MIFYERNEKRIERYDDDAEKRNTTTTITTLKRMHECLKQ